MQWDEVQDGTNRKSEFSLIRVHIPDDSEQRHDQALRPRHACAAAHSRKDVVSKSRASKAHRSFARFRDLHRPGLGRLLSTFFSPLFPAREIPYTQRGRNITGVPIAGALV